MIARSIETTLRAAASRFPVVTVTGPRQAGKTTLCRATFGHLPYVSLEAPDRREHAVSDPRGFLGALADGAVLDEIQRAPELTSYLQLLVDEDPRPGRFVLTGSQHFGLVESVSQSLAGRTAVLRLLPLGLNEVQRFESHPVTLDDVMRFGGYPRIHDQRLDPAEWLASYALTYVERDVRQILNVGDLATFQTFLRLCAGRSGQLLNLSALASDAGVTHNTARAWLSVLEASFIVFRLPPWFRNVNKRLVKTPKLFFYDTGLLCYLLGIRMAEHLAQHPLRGAIFETWCASEIVKSLRNRALDVTPYFFRDRRGREADLLLEDGSEVRLVEMKSAQTLAADFFTALDEVAGIVADDPLVTRVHKDLLYAGNEEQVRGDVHVKSWRRIQEASWIGGTARRQE